MKVLQILILTQMLSPLVAAQDTITPEQCEALHGTHTDLGCLMMNEPGSDKVDLSNANAATNKQCNCIGGRWNDSYGCLAPISAEECEKLGGQADPELGCVKKPTVAQCEAAGGQYSDDGNCKLKSAPAMASESEVRPVPELMTSRPSAKGPPPCGSKPKTKN